MELRKSAADNGQDSWRPRLAHWADETNFGSLGTALIGDAV
jgi:hypothetical protein